MISKKVCMLLATVLALSVFAGCSGANKSVQTTKTDDKAAANQVKVADLKGQTIKIVTNGGNVAPVGGTELGDLNVKWFEEVQKKYNCKIEIEKSDGTVVDKLVAAAMANDYYCDFMWGGANNTYNLASQGIVQPWDDYIDMKNPKIMTNNFPSYSIATKYDNKTYQLSVGTTSRPGDVLYFNKTLFKKYGIEMPYDMVKNKTWNWENFRKIAKQATIDTNNDGQPDIWGVQNAGFIDRAVGYFYANKATNTKLDANNKIAINITDPAYVETLEFLRTLSLVDKSMQPCDKTPDWDQGAKDFKAGKLAMTPYISQSKAIKDGFNEEFGIVPYPMGPRATTYTSGVAELYGWCMPSKIENAKDKATVLFDWLANNPYITDDMSDKLFYDSLAQYCYDTDTVDMYKIINKSDMLFDFSRFVSNASGYWGSNFSVISGQKTPAQVVEEQKPLYQAEIDKLYAPK